MYITHGIHDLPVSIIQVGLLFCELMKIILLAFLTPRPCWAIKQRDPIVRLNVSSTLSIGFAIMPYIYGNGENVLQSIKCFLHTKIYIFRISRFRFYEPFMLIAEKNIKHQADGQRLMQQGFTLSDLAQSREWFLYLRVHEEKWAFKK